MSNSHVPALRAQKNVPVPLAPITASVIVMEMTRTQDLTIYLLAASLLASFLSRQFNPHPFYHHMGHAFRREAMAIGRRQPSP